MSGCLADVAAALVDGELDHAARERAQRHLLHCDTCRAEVDRQRRLKRRLRDVSAPQPPDALTQRLLGLSAPVPAALPVTATSPRTARPVSAGPATRADAAVGPARGQRPGRALRRRAAAGSAVAVLGVAAALAMGAPAQRSTSTPVDPATDAFVTEFVSTTSDGVSGSLPTVPAPRAGTSGFVPLTRGTLLTVGGDRGSR